MSFNIRERFKERKFSYIFKKKLDNELYQELNDSKDIYKKNNFLKLIIFSPIFIIGYINKFFNYISSENDESLDKNNFESKNKIFFNMTNRDNSINSNLINHKFTEKLINKSFNKKIFSISLNNSSDKNKSNHVDKLVLKSNSKNNIKLLSDINKNPLNNTKKKIFFNKYVINKSNNKFNNNTIINNNNIINNKVVFLENKIFCKFKILLEALDNSFSEVESDIYLISKHCNDEKILDEATMIFDRIQKLIDKLEQIKIEFELFDDEKFIADTSLLNDSILIDDIYNYRDMINSFDWVIIPKKLKLLDEYNNLFTNLEEVENKLFDIKKIKDKKVQELSIRDKNFAKARFKMNSIDEIYLNCNFIIEKNNKYLEEISNKIEKINEKTFISYKLKGLNGLLSSSLKYIGLLSLAPLKCLIPSIAVKTVVTRRLISQMIKNIHYEKNEKIVYSVHNYIDDLNNKIFDIDNVSRNIEKAFVDVQSLKKEFKDYYFKYHLKEYEVAYKKIEKIEEDIIKSKNKIFMIRNQFIKNMELNEKVIKKVRKLNN